MHKYILLLSSIVSMNVMAENDLEFNMFSIDNKNLTLLTEFNFYTNHSDSTYTDEIGQVHTYNEDNELYSFAVRSGTITLGYSRFDNSYFDMSNMISLEHDWIQAYDFTFQVGIGFVDGYKEDIMDGGFFINDDWMIAPFFSLRYSPSFLEYKGFQVSPKIRMMGLDAYMANIEFSYSF